MEFTKDTKVWEALKKSLMELNKSEMAVGWFPEDVYGPENNNVSKAYIAQINEEGHINGSDSLFPGAVTPPRPFMRVGFKDYMSSPAADKRFTSIIRSVNNGQSVFKALKIGGDSFAEGLKQVMRDWQTPPNAAITIELKGFNDPLRSTGELIDSANAKVVKKDGTA